MNIIEGVDAPKTIYTHSEGASQASPGRPASAGLIGPLSRGPQGTTSGDSALGTRGPRPSGLTSRAEARRTDITMRALLEWAYGAQKVHRGGGRGKMVAPNGYSSMSATGAVLERLKLGCQVSGGGVGVKGSDCDQDALTVHCYVQWLASEERALVIRCAAVSAVPNWSPLIPPYACVPVPGRRGRPYKGIYDRHGNEVGCEVEYQGVPRRKAEERVRYAREIYGRWYSALAVLRDAVAAVDELRRWRVTGVGAEPVPWAA